MNMFYYGPGLYVEILGIKLINQDFTDFGSSVF